MRVGCFSVAAYYYFLNRVDVLTRELDGLSFGVPRAHLGGIVDVEGRRGPN